MSGTQLATWNRSSGCGERKGMWCQLRSKPHENRSSGCKGRGFLSSRQLPTWYGCLETGLQIVREEISPTGRQLATWYGFLDCKGRNFLPGMQLSTWNGWFDCKGKIRSLWLSTFAASVLLQMLYICCSTFNYCHSPVLCMFWWEDRFCCLGFPKSCWDDTFCWTCGLGCGWTCGIICGLPLGAHHPQTAMSNGHDIAALYWGFPLHIPFPLCFLWNVLSWFGRPYGHAVHITLLVLQFWRDVVWVSDSRVRFSQWSCASGQYITNTITDNTDNILQAGLHNGRACSPGALFPWWQPSGSSTHYLYIEKNFT